jgi:adenosylcobinamide-GDP ribazoletransferase
LSEIGAGLRRAGVAIAVAFAYFSVLPVGRFARGPGPDAAALLALPLVGAVIGALAGAVALGASAFAPHVLVAAFALGATVVASGALHLDGYLDGCDAFFASVSPARRLEILKDPHHGSFALAGLLVLGAVWYAALTALPAADYPATLALCAALSRGAAILGAVMYPYARGGRVDAAGLILVLATIASAAFLYVPVALAFVPAALGLAWLLARWIAGRLGGALPGDGYGFIITTLEVAGLSVAAILFAAGRWPGHG